MLNRWFWIELKEEILYWTIGKSNGYFSYISVKDRLEELKQIAWRQYRRTFRCPLGAHYIKWNSGDPKCILCNKRHREIFK